MRAADAHSTRERCAFSLVDNPRLLCYNLDCLFSLHRPFRSGTSEDLVGHGDFLNTSPVVFVSPHVPPPQEEEHGNHRDGEAAEEGLLADHWEEKEGQHRSGQAVLEPTKLVLGDPELAVLEVDLSRWGNVRLVDKEVHEL